MDVIFLDLDTFVVQPLYEFFDNDCTIGWPNDQNIGTQILIAKPNSRFLKLWMQSYKDYRPSLWYYNAGEFPTKHILEKNPHLVTRITEKFGVQNLGVVSKKMTLVTIFGRKGHKHFN